MSEKMIVFQIAEETYALEVKEVQSVERIEHITRIPGTASDIRGVINLRGTITTIIDLRMRMEKGDATIRKDSRLLVLSRTDDLIGLIVDSANEVLDVADDEVDQSLQIEKEKGTAYTRGLVYRDDRLIFLMDIEAVLQTDARTT